MREKSLPLLRKEAFLYVTVNFAEDSVHRCVEAKASHMIDNKQLSWQIAWERSRETVTSRLDVVND